MLLGVVTAIIFFFFSSKCQYIESIYYIMKQTVAESHLMYNILLIKLSYHERNRMEIV